MIATCIYCGFKIEHGIRHGATRADAHRALIKHDRQCPKNPIAQELLAERERADELAAHVEHITERARLVTDRRNWEGNADPRVPHVLLDKLSDACQAKRDASLARRDARVVADALEVLLKLARNGGGSAYMIETIETNIDHLRHKAGDIRRQAEEPAE